LKLVIKLIKCYIGIKLLARYFKLQYNIFFKDASLVNISTIIINVQKAAYISIVSKIIFIL